MARTDGPTLPPLPVSTVGALVDRAAELSDGDALVVDDARRSFAELRDDTVTTARRLLAAGVEHGQRVGLLVEDSLPGVAFLLGAMRIGAVPVPINGRYKEREISYVAAHADLRVLVIDPDRVPL